MKTSAITPVDRARRFRVDDLFFSTTDRKGVITACNDVFVRISGFGSDELLGAPHNVIRHPDMPRCVFHLLWSEILEGRPLGAYVKNIAATGEYYWVFALVLPLPDGFLSIRLKPTSPLLAEVEAGYQALLAEEARFGKDWREGMASASAMLPGFLASMGCSSYAELMAHALHTEIEARQTALGAKDPAAARLIHDIGHMRKVRQELARDDRVGEVGFDVRLLALNASVVAAKQGRAGRALGVIGQQIATVAREVLEEAGACGVARGDLAEALHDTSFRLSAFTLVREMERFFAASNEGDVAVAEQVRTGGASYEELEALLAEVGRASLERCRDNVARLERTSESFHRTNAALARTAIQLDVGQVTGKTLCAAVPRGAQFAQLLGQVSTMSADLRDSLWHQQESARHVAELVTRWRRTALR